jgi:pyridoxamine 5'-phosphate oxidase
VPLSRPRRDYRGAALLESRAPADPLRLFRRWLAVAVKRGGAEPTGTALATVDRRGRPRARMVLLREAGPEGFTFYTNHASAKGRELAARPEAALVLWWPVLHRQVRIEGRVSPLGERESDAYFARRPRGAQLGAWASPQSRVLRSRAELEARHARFAARFAGLDVPRPPHWGGYRLRPRLIEFWQGRPDRLHDRLCYVFRAGRWRRVRLAP